MGGILVVMVGFDGESGGGVVVGVLWRCGGVAGGVACGVGMVVAAAAVAMVVVAMAMRWWCGVGSW
jgi:hypothetical protein